MKLGQLFCGRGRSVHPHSRILNAIRPRRLGPLLALGRIITTVSTTNTTDHPGKHGVAYLIATPDAERCGAGLLPFRLPLALPVGGVGTLAHLVVGGLGIDRLRHRPIGLWGS